MKKLLIISIIFALSSCALLDFLNNSKRNEEFEYFAFNDKNKSTVNKRDIYVTQVSKFDSLNTALYEVRVKLANDAKHIGSWDFSARPSQKIRDEIDAKAVELGANYIILFEKKDCDHIDLARGAIVALEGTNCYIILYYNLPVGKFDIKNNQTVNIPVKTTTDTTDTTTYIISPNVSTITTPATTTTTTTPTTSTTSTTSTTTTTPVKITIKKKTTKNKK